MKRQSQPTDSMYIHLADYSEESNCDTPVSLTQSDHNRFESSRECDASSVLQSIAALLVEFDSARLDTPESSPDYP